MIGKAIKTFKELNDIFSQVANAGTRPSARPMNRQCIFCRKGLVEVCEGR